MGENLYEVTDGSGPPTDFQGGRDQIARIRQGWIEVSNVELANERAEWKRLIERIQTIRQMLSALPAASANMPPPQSDSKTRLKNRSNATAVKPHDLVTVEFDPMSIETLTLTEPQLIVRMSVEVVTVKPNGAASIEGHRKLVVDGGVIEQTLSGSVRPEAIQPDLTVRSEAIDSLRFASVRRP